MARGAVLTITKLPVKLDAFEGPLDLLLQLIRAQKIDIYDIPIAAITDQYMAYLTAMEEMDLEIASEFLVMAATLIDIKARMLFPTLGGDARGDEDSGLDPREELSRRLVEYEKFAQAGRVFREMAAHGALYGYRPVREERPITRTLMPGQDVASLVASMRRFRSRLAPWPAAEVTPERPTMFSQIRTWLRELRQRGGHARFLEVVGQHRPKRYLVTAFLALLELVRLGRLVVMQAAAGDDILIMPGPAWRQGPRRPGAVKA